MSSPNKRNLHYFEATTMADLHKALEAWQSEHEKRLLSVSIQADSGKFCCIALTNPTEVVLTNVHGAPLQVSIDGCLLVGAYMVGN